MIDLAVAFDATGGQARAGHRRADVAVQRVPQQLPRGASRPATARPTSVDSRGAGRRQPRPGRSVGEPIAEPGCSQALAAAERLVRKRRVLRRRRGPRQHVEGGADHDENPRSSPRSRARGNGSVGDLRRARDRRARLPRLLRRLSPARRRCRRPTASWRPATPGWRAPTRCCVRPPSCSAPTPSSSSSRRSRRTTCRSRCARCRRSPPISRHDRGRAALRGGPGLPRARMNTAAGRMQGADRRPADVLPRLHQGSAVRPRRSAARRRAGARSTRGWPSTRAGARVSIVGELPTITADPRPDAPAPAEPDRQRAQVPARGRRPGSLASRPHVADGIAEITGPRQRDRLRAPVRAPASSAPSNGCTARRVPRHRHRARARAARSSSATTAAIAADGTPGEARRSPSSLPVDQADERTRRPTPRRPSRGAPLCHC